MTPEAQRALLLRSDLSQAAVAKYAKIRDIQVDGRVTNLLQINGASRTGRWAGRALQIQNLKRPTIGNPEVAADLLASDLGMFEDLYTLEDLGSLVRSSITASPGNVLIACDLSSIESRVLGWVSRCPKLLRVFEESKDPYKAFAVEWMRKPYDQITKQERNLSKPPTLGCGYGLGAAGLVRYADSMGIVLTEEQALSAVRAFRSGYPEIPKAWREVEGCFVYTTMTGNDQQWGNLVLRSEGPFTTIELPSGRKLWYFRPSVKDGEICFWGQNTLTHKWEEIRTYGARLIENIVQAVARDVLLHGMFLADRSGLNTVFHVHDEIVCEEPECQAEDGLARLVGCMCKTPSWASGLPLGASGYVSRRYKKD